MNMALSLRFSRHIYVGVSVRAHPGVVNRTFNVELPKGCNKGYSNSTKMVIYSTVQTRCYITNNTGMRARRKFSTDRQSRYRLLTMQYKWTFT